MIELDPSKWPNWIILSTFGSDQCLSRPWRITACIAVGMKYTSDPANRYPEATVGCNNTPSEEFLIEEAAVNFIHHRRMS